MAEGYADYTKRLSRELPLELVEVAPGLRGKGRDAARAMHDEGERVLAALPKHAWVVALDGRGKPYTSEQLAERLAAWRQQGRDLAFLIGGPEGHAPDVWARADERWAFGPMTLPHMLVRLLVAEQLYRACSILGNHPTTAPRRAFPARHRRQPRAQVLPLQAAFAHQFRDALARVAAERGVAHVRARRQSHPGVPPAGLGLVERRVGEFQRMRPIGLRGGAERMPGPTHGKRQRERAFGAEVEVEAVPVVEQARHPCRHGVLAQAAEDDDEFLAAPARQQVAFARGPAQEGAEVAQHGVAGGVPVVVVHPLEMVDVDQGEDHALRMPRQHRRHLLEHGAPVRQAGQRVGLALDGQHGVRLFEPLVRPLPLRGALVDQGL